MLVIKILGSFLISSLGSFFFKVGVGVVTEEWMFSIRLDFVKFEESISKLVGLKEPSLSSLGSIWACKSV